MSDAETSSVLTPVPFSDRSRAMQVVLAGILPAALGALAGVMLGVSSAAYWAVGAIAAIGGLLRRLRALRSPGGGRARLRCRCGLRDCAAPRARHRGDRRQGLPRRRSAAARGDHRDHRRGPGDPRRENRARPSLAILRLGALRRSAQNLAADQTLETTHDGPERPKAKARATVDRLDPCLAHQRALAPRRAARSNEPGSPGPCRARARPGSRRHHRCGDSPAESSRSARTYPRPTSEGPRPAPRTGTA